jgi:hypothetical protein
MALNQKQKKKFEMKLTVKENKPSKQKNWPTVKEMLEYIKDNKIPMDAEIIIEHIHDFYLLENHWSHYRCPNDWDNGDSLFLPVHNGFGSIGKDKKFFVLWMHM